jgi:tetratricopeptide (TPR) repeat protein
MYKKNELALSLINDGILLGRKKRYEEAIKLFDKAIKLNPNYSFAYSCKANSLSNLEKYKKAIKYYEKSLGLNSTDTYALNNKAICLVKLNKYQDALLCYDRAIQLSSKKVNNLDNVTDVDESYIKNYINVYNNKGILLLKLKKINEAILCFDKAKSLSSNNNNNNIDLLAFQKSLKMYDKIIKLDPKDYTACNNKGVFLTKLEKYNEAIECFKEAITLNPKYIKAYNNLGYSYQCLNMFKEASLCFDKSLEIKCNVDACLFKGKLLFDSKLYFESAHCYDKALEIDSNNIHALYNRGLLYAKLNDYDKSLEYLNKVIHLDPNEPDNYVCKAYILAQSNKFKEEAIYYYDKSIELNSNLISSYFNKANLMKELKYYDKALKLYDLILNKNANDPIVLNNKGLCLLDMNLVDEALAYFDEAIKYDPTYSNAYNSKGYLLAFKLQNYSQALDCFDKAIQNSKILNVDSFIGKGYCLHNLDRLTDAEIAYKQAIEYNDSENNPIIYYNIGCVLIKQNKFKEAIQYFDKTLELDSTFKSALNNKNIAMQLIEN